MPYWLRAVRAGIVVTALTVMTLLVLAVLPGHPEYRSAGYAAVLAVGAAGGVIVARLPWRALFQRGLGILFLYAWSAADILLVSVAVVVTGGARSQLFLVYTLTTVFFGAAYPRRAQAGLLAFTFACYLTGLAVTGWGIGAATLFLRLAVLAILALLAFFLASELMREMGHVEQERARAERWASMLSAVAGSARQMSLERDAVVDAACRAVQRFGFEVVTLHVLARDGSASVAKAIGLPDGFQGEPHPASIGIVGRVAGAGATVIEGGAAALGELFPAGTVEGFGAVLATPVWIGGRLGAVLVGATREPAEVLAQQVQATELLAAQLGLALANVERFDHEHEMVERLAELDRLKLDFLASVSHEFRTPVTVIKGAGLTLERSWEAMDPDVRAEMLAGLNANAGSLEGLIVNLLDLSRLDAGALVAGFEPMDLSAMLALAADRFEARFPARRLIRDVAPGLVAHADPAFIDRVVENLLSNAAKHTPPGTVALLRAERQQGSVLVAVRDDGPGIPPHELEHLGERFYRRGDINTRPRGLGLGLALAREMLRVHDSDLVVASVPGGGSTFSFELRAAGVPEPQPDGPTGSNGDAASGSQASAGAPVGKTHA